MIKLINLKKTKIDKFRYSFLELFNQLHDKKLSKVRDIFKYVSKDADLRSSIFNALNMHPYLGSFNDYLQLELKKILNVNLINWTYPQIRLDGLFSKRHLTPLHQEEWIQFPDKTGYIIWVPISERGASIWVADDNFHDKKIQNELKMRCIMSYLQKENLNKFNEKDIKFIKSNKYLKKFQVNYGQALIFSKEIPHKSDLSSNRVTVISRFEEIKNLNNFNRSQLAKCPVDITNFWDKKIKRIYEDL